MGVFSDARDFDWARSVVVQVQANHGQVRSALRGLLEVVAVYNELLDALKLHLEARFPGCGAYASQEWPWDTARFSPSLLDDPQDYPPGLSVHGPDMALFDVEHDVLVRDPYDARRSEQLAAIPTVSWTPRELIVACGELMEVAKATIYAIVEEREVSSACAYCKKQVALPMPGVTPRLNVYGSDRLVICSSCGKISVTFVTHDGIELRPVQ